MTSQGVGTADLNPDSVVLHESFLDYQDASTWLYYNLEYYGQGWQGYTLLEARIVYLNHKWVAGASFVKKEYQLELPFD